MTRPTIVQIAPEIGAGTGVGEVARALESAWREAGIPTTRFTMTEAHGDWIPKDRAGVAGKLDLMARVVWFSTVGTLLARRMLRRKPDLLSVCHNDALAGDLYVNHGVIQASMRSRGRFAVRMVRNPMHLFVATRDRIRYSGNWHGAVVNLSSVEEVLLRDTYHPFRPATLVIGNGFDLDRFRPATTKEKRDARRRFGVPLNARVVLFVGHEFDRKGLEPLMSGLASCPIAHTLLVVGGTSDAVERAVVRAGDLGLRDRVIFTGSLADSSPAFAASDVFALPSAYESFGLVYLEALASGLPVIAPAVGCVPDVVVDRENGLVVAAQPKAISDALVTLDALDAEAMTRRCRDVAEQHSWTQMAVRYAEALYELHDRRVVPA